MQDNGTPTHVLNERFYNGQDKYDAEVTINKHIGNRITKEDAALIRAYIAEKQTVAHIGEARSRKIAVHLVGMRRFIKASYDKMNTDDVIAGISALKSGHAERFKRVKGTKDETKIYDGGPFAPNTIRDYIKILKGFISWLNDTKRGKRNQIDERRLKHAQKIEGAGRTPYKPEDLFTRDEINALVLAARTLRDKCFINLLFETAARPGEIGRLVWGDLNFTPTDYVECQLWDTKKKGYRYPTIVESRGLLAAWRNDYKGNAEGDNFVFIEDNGMPLTRTACVRIIERAAEKAGKTMPSILTKPYWKTYNMRHSGATDMVNSGLRTEDLCEVMWGNPNSAQVSTYVNRSKDKVREATLKLRGIKKPEAESEDDNKPIRCPKCREVNPPRKKFCGNCGRPLTEAAKAETDKLESKAYEYMIKRLEALEAQVKTQQKQ